MATKKILQMKLNNKLQQETSSTRFVFLRQTTYTCNSITKAVKEYHHIQTGLDFVMIPGGTFEMGNRYGYDVEKPIRQVTVSPYLISKTVVTQKIWKKIMNSMPSYFKIGLTILTHHPVEQVSWNDCQIFCHHTGLKLPTEIQWEYAARGGSNSLYYFGDSPNELDKYAWYNHNSGGKTHPVAQKLPNAYGLYDMLGNVWEWCNDSLDSVDGSIISPSSDISEDGEIIYNHIVQYGNFESYEHILRGGCFALGGIICRPTFRNWGIAGCRNRHNGFRVVSEFSPEEKLIMDQQELDPPIIVVEQEESFQGFTFLQNAVYNCGRTTKEVQEYTHTLTQLIFVLMPGGTFLMGSSDRDSDERPPHSVTLSPYLISKTQVPQSVWQNIMATNPSGFKKGNNYPVESVTWSDCQAFCHKTGLKLPTEAQWEYAAHGGTTTTYYFGDSEASLVSYAWYDVNASGTTHPVATKMPNAYGLYDMGGNVWEWCEDWYSDCYRDTSHTHNPKGVSTGTSRIIRGGSWQSGSDSLRPANRNGVGPEYARNDRGFRVVYMEEEEE